MSDWGSSGRSTRDNRSLDTAVPPRVQSLPARHRVTETAPARGAQGRLRTVRGSCHRRTWPSEHWGLLVGVDVEMAPDTLRGAYTDSQMRFWHGRIPCGLRCVVGSDSL